MELGIQKYLDISIFSPIRYLMYKWYSLYLITVESKSEKYLYIKFQILRNKKSDIFLYDKLSNMHKNHLLFLKLESERLFLHGLFYMV